MSNPALEEVNRESILSQVTEMVPVTREQNLKTLTEVADDLVVSITDEAEKQLATLQEEYSSDKIPADLSDKSDYEKVHKAIQVIKKPRIALENSRKEVVSPLNTAAKKVNEAAKPLKESYIAIEEPWKKAKKDHDDDVIIAEREAIRVEEERVTDILARISVIETTPTTNINSDQSTLRALLDNSFNGDGNFDWAEEFSEKARDIYSYTKGKLEEMLKFRVEQDSFAREKADREAKDAEEKANREAEEEKRIAEEKKSQEEQQAKLDAQQAAIDAQKAEIYADTLAIEKQKRELDKAREAEKQEAIDKAKAEKQATIDKKKEEDRKAKEKKDAEERDRIMLENKKKEEKEKLEKEEFAKKNRTKVAKSVLPNLIPFCKSKKAAGELLVAIMDGEIEHLAFLVSVYPHIDG